jgi:predicted TIM-barrel fold metal-dependent hydrolase
VRRGTSLFPTKLEMKPTEYMKRQVFFTYINDQQAVRDRYEIGVDNLLWSSDYPHNASTWPKSQEVVDKSFEIVTDEEERQKLIRDNGLQLYNLISVGA